jgi:NADH:ubiquinone oxidoreductase subunit F (NADH-binding)/NADH:ubiquinone oxidoreductase subunit E
VENFMIVQELHKIQHKHGYLPAEELHKLSRRIDAPLYRLQEVASFFPHFRLRPGPKVELLVCHDMACHLRGAASMQAQLEGEFQGRSDVHVKPVSCLGRCDRPVAALLNNELFVDCSAERLKQEAEKAARGEKIEHDADGKFPRHMTEPWKCDLYRGACDYKAVRHFLTKLDGDKLIEELKKGDLRGMGGAGVPAAQKWSDVRKAVGEKKYIVCNADESEPTTFKDREILLRAPFTTLEGMILAGLYTGATRGYVYVRHEYHEQIEVLNREIERARSIGACGTNVFGSGRTFQLEVFESPGGYICGEQSALIEAMEDKRAQPRNKPPQLETNGLNNMPTLVSNVETFAWAPFIAYHGGEAYAKLGAPGCKGARFFSICGDVKKPGAYEVPNGTTLGALVELAGGMKGKLKAVAPSGPSGGFVPARVPVADLPRGWDTKLPASFVEKVKASGKSDYDILDFPLDLQCSRDMGLMLGAGMMVYAEGANIMEHAVNCLEFFRKESCGKCVPCRLGTEKMVEMTHVYGDRRNGDGPPAWGPTIADLSQAMTLTSICGLGAVAANPLTWVLKYFPEDVASYRRGSTTASKRGSSK